MIIISDDYSSEEDRLDGHHNDVYSISVAKSRTLAIGMMKIAVRKAE